MENMTQYIVEFEAALLQIDRVKAAEILEECYLSESKFEALEAMVTGALEIIGQGWEKGTISLSQLYMSGVICEELIEQYLPKLAMLRVDVPKIAIAALEDHHALGKRIVSSILRAAGFELMDFGQGLNIESLVQKTIEHQIEILLISTLMLPSALKVKMVKESLAAAGAKTKIIVGGAPFRMDTTLWKTVGADADGKNATDIAKIIDQVMKGEPSR